MIKLYHGTPPNDVFNILREGLKPGPDGYIYFCKNEKDCMTYSSLYNPNRHEIAIIPVEFSEEEFRSMIKNLDNNPEYTPDAYAYEGTINKGRIPSLLGINRYIIERVSETK